MIITQRVPTVLAGAFALILASALVVGRPPHGQERAAPERGARLFTDHGCYGCHRVGNLGTPIGPDLSRVGAKYTEKDLVRWLSDPASQRPNAHMPKLELAPADVDALAAFLATRR